MHRRGKNQSGPHTPRAGVGTRSVPTTMGERMQIGLCYESVLPARGGCEHYISDLARRLARDGHGVHLFASRWDANALPSSTVYHKIPQPTGPRFLKPWRFASACIDALQANPVDVSMGFDKTWGQDILYPQGGLHSASRVQNLVKHEPGPDRFSARLARLADLSSYSFARLERRQYLTSPRPQVLAISHMVADHFRTFLGLDDSSVQVLHASIDPERFVAVDRLARRARERLSWRATADDAIGLFVGMNYRLKGLAQLLKAMAHVPRECRFRLMIVGSAKYARYESLAKQLGIGDRVKFLGFQVDPRDAYFASDFLVHPTFYDPCSLVALEALACGLPVLTTHFNGAAELLPPGNPVVRDPHDAHELASAISNMCDPVLLPARRLAALEAGQKWTFEDHYRKLFSVFEEVLARKRGTRAA